MLLRTRDGRPSTRQEFVARALLGLCFSSIEVMPDEVLAGFATVAAALASDPAMYASFAGSCLQLSEQLAGARAPLPSVGNTAEVTAGGGMGARRSSTLVAPLVTGSVTDPPSTSCASCTTRWLRRGVTLCWASVRRVRWRRSSRSDEPLHGTSGSRTCTSDEGNDAAKRTVQAPILARSTGEDHHRCPSCLQRRSRKCHRRRRRTARLLCTPDSARHLLAGAARN